MTEATVSLFVTGRGNNFERLEHTLCPSSLFNTLRTCRGAGGEARLPAEVMIFEPSLWPQACVNAALA
eukprot:scaffold158261_cov62-Attheya_sp.AAC.6